ncbi:MAG: hypothetical protein NTW49_08115 [Bacteroidia bacterium]|nr:hypothetical protein [Bacteroidia bacterium]
MNSIKTINANCPGCGASLMDRTNPVDRLPGIHLLIDTGNNKGNIQLSSVCGSTN